MDLIESMIRRLRSRVDAMITTAVINRVNDAMKMQGLQITATDGEVIPGVTHRQPYGVSFTPPEGAECTALSMSGARSNTVAICPTVPGDRPTGNPARTGGLYQAGEWMLFIDEHGIVNLGAKSGADYVALAAKVDAEIKRIWDTLTDSSIVPAPASGPDAGETGLALLLTAASTAAAAVQHVAATKAKAT